MKNEYYQKLTKLSLKNYNFSKKICVEILSSKKIELLKLIDAAYQVRKKYCGNSVKIHILNNVQNGLCSEDCGYCAQSKNSKAIIEKYSAKPENEILKEAKNAYDNGAFRYCMVYSGKQASDERINKVCKIIKKIKSKYPIEVCVSTGIINQNQAKKLKEAGLNRLNHNINTSRKLYKHICTTHSYDDRLNTIKSAHKVNLEICSGVIIGMGENIEDIIDMAKLLRDVKAESIPVNFFIPIKDLVISNPPALNPEFCLRVLCLFRFLNPEAEIRVAAGRELHLRDMEILAFYPANSLFLDGYLNAKGESRLKTLQMLKDGGFTIVSDKNLDDLIKKNQSLVNKCTFKGDVNIKTKADLRPSLNKGE